MSDETSDEKWGFPPTKVDMLTGETVQEGPTSKFPLPIPHWPFVMFGNGHIGRVLVKGNGMFELFVRSDLRSLSSTIALRNALNEAIAYQEGQSEKIRGAMGEVQGELKRQKEERMTKTWDELKKEILPAEKLEEIQKEVDRVSSDLNSNTSVCSICGKEIRGSVERPCESCEGT